MSDEKVENSEHILWSGACSQWHYFGHWFVGLLLVAASVAGLYYFREDVKPWLPWAYLAPVVLLVILVSVIAWKRAARRYQVTSGRVVVKTGRFVVDSNEIRIQDIRSINVSKHGIGGFIGIGTIEFASAAADDAEVIFVGIAGADGVRDTVRKLQSPEAAV